MTEYTHGKLESRGTILFVAGDEGAIICEMSEPNPSDTPYLEHRRPSLRSLGTDGLVAENERRLMACWNACEAAGLTTEALEAGILNDLPAKLLSIRDAMAREDYEEAYHRLYSIASPTFAELEPWKLLEACVAEKGKDRS